MPFTHARKKKNLDLHFDQATSTLITIEESSSLEEAFVTATKACCCSGS